MGIVRTAMIDDDGSGTTGTIINNAWKTEFYNQIDGLVCPAWTAFTPANITDASGNPLTNSIQACRYRRLGNDIVIWHFTMDSISVGTSTASIFLSGVPFGFVGTQYNPVAQASAAAVVDSYSTFQARLRRFDQTNWAPGAYFFRFMTIWEVTSA